MKKVLALVLAVLMLATVAMAATRKPQENGCNAVSDKATLAASVNPGDTLKIAREYIDSGDWDTDSIKLYTSQTEKEEPSKDGKVAIQNTPLEGVFRSITTDNYSINRVKYEHGKNLISEIKINDAEQRVDINFVEDLTNTGRKDFEVRFTLKGKGKMTLRDEDLALANGGANLQPGEKDYNAYMEIPFGDPEYKVAGNKVSIPDVKFLVIGTVGFGKVEISIGDDQDEEIEDLSSMGVDIGSDVVKFVRKTNQAPGYSTRVAGAFTADAILTEEYGEALTLEARVYHNDVLFFDIDYAPNRDIIGRLADSDADMDFYCFNTDTRFTTFNSNAKLYFNDADENDFVYQIKDQKLVPTGEYSEDDGCWVVKTRTLGQYVVSDVELTEFEAAAGEVDGNPDTGANDVVGIATALAAVALVSAAAVSLKK